MTESSDQTTPSSDWIERYLQYTEGITSPNQFRLWSGITALAGAMERRMWVEVGRGVIYPNLFTLLVAPPAVGKSVAINQTSELWYKAKKFKVSPDSLTKASLVDALAGADRKMVFPDQLVEYHTLLIPCGELGVFMSSHDNEFLSFLNNVYDNPSMYRENRRTQNRVVEITHPQLTILAGTQPGFLASILPENAWGMGFMSRMIMIYGAKTPFVDPFQKQESRPDLKRSLVSSLEKLSNVFGKFSWDMDAVRELQRWFAEGLQPVPEHSKLEHYNGRRVLYIFKLSMVAAISRSMELNITLEDVNRARDWLLGAEQTMPDVFREMVGKNDSDIIQELYFFAFRIFAKEKKPVHEGRLIHFLQHRVPSEKVVRILELAERSSVLTREAGEKTYTPRPRNEHGVE